MDFAAMAELCAPNVAAHTMRSIASVESSFNPFAIGVVDAQLQRQPRNIDEAIATAQMLEVQGFNYSVGLVQVNKSNFAKFGVNAISLFDPCTNLRVGARIFEDCYKRAGGSINRTGDALSCYYSGNFKTGYSHGYVDKVLNAGGIAPTTDKLTAIPVIKATARKRARHSTVAGKPEPLFVAAANSPDHGSISTRDGSQTPTGPGTALLF